MPRLPRPLVRFAVSAFQTVRRAVWFVTRPTARGVHAVALTPTGKVILVRVTYARGWRLPGGGLKRGESAEAALLRELEEEIGLVAHGELRHVDDFEHRPDFRRGIASLFLLRGVRYRFEPSLEIDAVAEFEPGALPADVSDFTRLQIERALA